MRDKEMDSIAMVVAVLLFYVFLFQMILYPKAWNWFVSVIASLVNLGVVLVESERVDV